MEERIRSIIESLVVSKDNDSDELHPPPALVRSVSRTITYDVPNSNTAANFGQLHGDYFESEDYVYTAILYDEPTNLRGGETAIVDARGGFEVLTGEQKNVGDAVVSRNAAVGEEETSLHVRSMSRPPIELMSGVIVEPKRGRLLVFTVFTGGGENVYARTLADFGGTKANSSFVVQCG